MPLANLRATDGKAPAVTQTQNGFTLTFEGKLEADVNAPADAFLCRVDPAANPDIVQLAIGRVESARCDAVYSPTADLAIQFVPASVPPAQAASLELRWKGDRYHLSAGGPFAVRLHPNYMKTERGLKWFKPLDRNAFGRAPAGWCSWYVYWQNITEDETIKNTDWLAKNLKPFGCEYVQIDDGWQGVGHGNGENRNWYVTEQNKFPHGMKWLADNIRTRGFKPGLWLIPFSTSDDALFRSTPKLFIRTADGTTIGEKKDPKTDKTEIEWTGQYIVDPTGPEGQKSFTDLFKMICDDWGYDYVKIDGQGGSRGACGAGHVQLANTTLAPDEAYRAGLVAMKSVMGPRRFLLNCGGQLDSDGFCEGIRTGGDVGPSWNGMQPAIQATMHWLFLNGLCFWTDPDVVCVRTRGNNGSSLTEDQVRLWATLYGITGQLLMTSDKMYALPDSSVELLRRIFPVADIRPMDLYPFVGKPRIFDLRVATPGAGEWDVVALFNWSDSDSAQISLDPHALGLPAGSYTFYDVWAKTLAGVGANPLPVALRPSSCRVLCVRRFEDRPQLVGVSRHLTQGADDLLAASWDAAARRWQGRSAVVGGDPYELRFTLPPGWTCEAPVRIEGPLAVLTLTSDTNRNMPWSLAFKRNAEAAPSAPRLNSASLTQQEYQVTLSWHGDNAIGYRVYRNGELVNETGADTFTDFVRRRGKLYRYDVSAVGWQGESSRVSAGEVTLPPLPRGTAKDAWLADLQPCSAIQDYGHVQNGKSVDEHPLSIGGTRYERGLGTHANSELTYRLGNRYARFDARVGVDDEKGGLGSVVFQVIANGEKIFDSGVLRGKQPAQAVSLPLEGVDELRLVVTDAGDGINSDHADWADAFLTGNH